MNEGTQILTDAIDSKGDRHNEPGFPKAIMSASREEFYGQNRDRDPLELTVRDGKTGQKASLPNDLTGHSFIIGPVGSVASYQIDPATNTVLPSYDGWTPLLNGDGMIYRIDFHKTPIVASGETHAMKEESGKAWLTSRLVKPPSYYADKITYQDGTADMPLKFWDLGISRFSLAIGLCSQVNTGLQPIKFPGDTSDRLLATNDASRPYEIDPYSLKTIAPVGSIADWIPMIQLPYMPPSPLPGVMTSAHPCVVPATGELLTVDIQRDIKTTFRLPFSLRHFSKKSFWKDVLEVATELLIQLFELLLAILSFLGLLGKNAIYLVQWNGENELNKWQVVLPNGSPVEIKQSSHMMGLTENYIVLADTAFKLSAKDMLPASLMRLLGRKLSKVEKVKIAKGTVEEELEWLENHLTYPQSPDTYLYVIDRKQLNEVKPGNSIYAQRIKVEGEFAHFLTDYQETPDGRIIIHAAMTYATDPAEFINESDSSVYQIDGAMRKMAGMWSNPTDVNSPAAIAIDPKGIKAPQKYELDILEALRYTMFLGLYAYRDERPTQYYEDIYWAAGAADPKLFTTDICELYKNYKYRRISLAQIQQYLKHPTPMFLLRSHIDRNELIDAIECDREPNKPILTIADSYQLPQGYIANSPQFVPRDNSKGSTDGYIVCDIVYSDNYLADTSQGNDPNQDWSDNSEIWIFDANDLAQGPIYKLSHPKLNLGLTLHTAWMKDIAPAPVRDYQISEDYADIVAKAVASHRDKNIGKQIEELFEKIYEQFNAAK